MEGGVGGRGHVRIEILAVKARDPQWWLAVSM